MAIQIQRVLSSYNTHVHYREKIKLGISTFKCIEHQHGQVQYRFMFVLSPDSNRTNLILVGHERYVHHVKRKTCLCDNG